MCGGKSTTTQSTTIPPEVLARYNAVNARAEEVANTPFQPYTGEFVAPINQQQMAGIGNINAAAGMAQPYFNQATSALNTAYGQATPYYDQSLQSVAGGMGRANDLYSGSLSSVSQGMGRANDLYGTALSSISNGVNIGAQYGQDAKNIFNNVASNARPYMNQANEYVTSGLGAASPLMQQSQNFLTNATQEINPEEFNSAQINRYMSPYMSKVIDAQTKLAEQQNAIQRSALNTNAIGAGAFGGDRAGIAQANLAGQQSLAQQSTMANLLNQGYGQALGAFQQQQGVNLQAQQANRAAQQFGQQAAANLAQQAFGQNLAASQQTGNIGQAIYGQQMGQGQALQGLGQQLYAQNLGASQAQSGIAQNQFNMGAQQAALQQAAAQGQFGMAAQQAALQQQAAQGIFGMGANYASGMAGLGMGAQQAALQGAQAQIGAGTLQQQTQQAQDTAQYQQFLQERGYPFQVSQFLANIAMGTGALSGSTTSTTGPNNFFSDRRLKKDVKEIGETHDGLPIYSFKYKNGDEQPRIGFMADEVREKHPDAVTRQGGVDSVNYEKVANRESEGGGVMPSRSGMGYAFGGNISDQDLASIISMQREFLGPHEKGGLYGGSAGNMPGGAGVVPQKGVHVARLQQHSAPPRQANEMQQAMATAEQAEKVGSKLFGEKGYLTKDSPLKDAWNKAKEVAGVKPSPAAAPAAKVGGLGVGQPTAQTQQPDPNPASPTNQRSFYQKDEDFDPTKLMVDDALAAARGGVIRPAYSTKGRVASEIYNTDNPIVPDYVVDEDTPDKIGEIGSGSGKSGSGSSGSGLSNAIGLASTAVKGGELFAKALPFILAPFGLKDGGSVSYAYGGGIRPGYATEGAVEDEETDGGGGSQYKIDPILLKDMPEHRQAMIKDIYGPESGGRYDIRYGGADSSPKTFDQNGFHPNIPERRADGRYSTAAGAGQFIKSTWDDITGGAPMTQGYQDNATWTLASRDYNKRTGRDLDKDLQEFGGVTPEIRAALAPTWEAYQKQGGVKPSSDGRRSVAGAESIDGKDYVNGQEQKSGLGSFMDTITSPRVLAPLGTGILAMASSPSRYFGGALLTGIGAGLAATQPSEALEQRIQGQRISNTDAAIELGKKGWFERNGMIVIMLPNGQQLEYPDWVKAGKPTPIGGDVGASIIEQNAEKLGLKKSEQQSEVRRGTYQTQDTGSGTSTSGQTSGTVAAPAAPAVPGTTGASVGAPSNAPKPIPSQYTVTVPQSSVKAAEAEEMDIYGKTKDAQEQQVARNNEIQNRALNQKQAASALTDKLNELAAPLASMASGQQIAPGYFAKLNAFASDVYNGLIDQMKLPQEYKMDVQGLTDYQIAQKASTLLTSDLAKNLNDRAYAALQYLSQGVANPSMQADAARELLANAMVEKQRAIEEALFIQKYNQGRTKTVGSRASDEFRIHNPDEMYKEQKDALKKLMSESIDGVPVINYILRTGGNRNPEIQKRFTPDVVNQKYGFNVSRYLLNTAN